MWEGSEWAFSEGTLLNDAFRHTLPRAAHGGLEEEEYGGQQLASSRLKGQSAGPLEPLCRLSCHLGFEMNE